MDANNATNDRSSEQRNDLRGFGATKTGKTNTRNVKCTPPNKKCGGRCIPPSWDCRLKGQGTNSELKVFRNDPSAGIAGIVRGGKNLAKGVASGNVEQVERGRQGIIRGAVKLAPGNSLEKKKQLRKQLTEASAPIMGTLAVGILGFSGHMALRKVSAGYRNGLGGQIDRAAVNAVNRVLDNTPVIGGRRNEIRARGAAAAAGIGGAFTREQLLNASREGSNASRNPRTNELSRIPATALSRGQNSDGLAQEIAKASPQRGFEEWQQSAVERLYGYKVGTADKKHSVYSEYAANELLANQFKLDRRLVASGGKQGIQDAVGRKLQAWKQDLIQDMELRGFRNPETGAMDVTGYVDRFGRQNLNLPGTSKLSAAQRAQVETRALEEMTYLLTENSAATTLGRRYQNEAIKSFDTFFDKAAQNMQRNAVAADSPFGEGAVGLARYLNARGKLGVGGGAPIQIRSREHARLLLRQHWQANLMNDRGPLTGVSDAMVRRVAQRVAQTTELPTVTEAYSILQVRGGLPRLQPAVKPQRRMSLQQRIGERAKAIMRAQGVTMEQALRYAKTEIEFEEFRGDATQGKPCGESFIPKAHTCNKGKGASSDKGDPEQKASPNKAGTAGKAAIAAAIGVVGAMGVAVAVDVNRLQKGSPLPPPPSFRTTIKGVKKENPGVDTQTALGMHYTKVVEAEGWKPGQLVYTRYDRGSGANDHYGIYLGYNKGQHLFANFGAADGNWGRATMVGAGPGGDMKQPFIYSKVPESAGGGSGKFNQEELNFRVIESATKDLRYDQLENNCESWARMIVEGAPRSTQTARVSAVSKTIFRAMKRKKYGSWGDLISMKSEARRLDLEYKSQVGGDVAAYKELDVFYDLLGKGRLDGVAEDLGLPSPSELLPAGISDLEAAQRVRMYLMLAVRASRSLQKAQKLSGNRTDAKRARKGKGKPCGESFIPKDHECLKQRGSQATKVAAVAGAVTLGAVGASKLKLGEFHTGLTQQDLFGPVRKRRFGWMQKNQKPLSASEMAAAFNGLEKVNGVIPQNVQNLQSFIVENKLYSSPKTFWGDMREGVKTSKASPTLIEKGVKAAEKMTRVGHIDGMASQYTDNVMIRSTRKDPARLNVNPQELSDMSGRFMDRRQKAETAAPSLTERYRQLFTISRNTNDGDVTEAATLIHEVAHKVHFKASLNNGATPDSIGLGNMFDPTTAMRYSQQTAVKSELRRAASEYGKTDLFGRRAETFAELSTLYVTQGERFKREFPLAYDWVDAIWEKAK